MRTRLALTALLLLSCVPQPQLPALEPLSDAQAMARLEKDAARRERADLVVKAALPGLEGVVMNATVDVACQAPQSLSVSVRSFFEVPMQVLTANDHVVTLYDASSGTPRFAQGPASERSLTRVLGVPLAPDDATALILGRAPLHAHKPGWPAPRVRVVDVDDKARTYTAAIERPGRGLLRWTARFDDDAAVAVEAFTGDGRPLVRAELSQHAAHSDVLFAQRVTVKTTDGKEVVLTVQQGSYNGTPLPPESFSLTPPPGAVIDPL